MNPLLQDLRFAVLLLLKDKTFNLVALLTLALCIGAKTAIFSVVNSILLRPFAGVGIYGVLAYVVSQRRKEIGIRMALGADPRVVIRSVAGQGLRLAALGLTVGLVTAFLLTRLMESVLFDVTPGDPLVLATVSTVLLSVALLASMIPSLRATRINPSSALRND